MKPEIYVRQLYCESTDCNVRTVEVITKAYHSKDPETWLCPACRGRLKEHWRVTRLEYQAQQLRDSIGLVNAALYEREHSPQCAVPLRVSAVDSLPDSWNATEPKGAA